LPGLSLRALRGEWLEEGIRFWFTPTSENLEAIVSTVDRERRCCAFLDFHLHIPNSGAAIELEISGPPETRDFLNQLEVRPPSEPDNELHSSS
jgi:hypothetical protein